MTKEELYKLTDILNGILDNYLRGSEAEEVIAKFEDAVENSGLSKEELVSEDLKEAACNYGDELDNVLVVGKDDDNTVGEYATQAFKAGANWQKQQMVAKAVDGKIYETQARSKLKAVTIGNLSRLDYRVGDKVKVIIVKED